MTLTCCPSLTRARSFSKTFASIQTLEISTILNTLSSEATVAPTVALRSTTTPEIGDVSEKTATKSALVPSALMSASFKPSISSRWRAAVNSAFADAIELSAVTLATCKSCSAV